MDRNVDLPASPDAADEQFPTDRETGLLMPPSVDEWLPERHLARFIVEVVEGLDLRGMSGSYRGSGSAPMALKWRPTPMSVAAAMTP